MNEAYEYEENPEYGFDGESELTERSEDGGEFDGAEERSRFEASASAGQQAFMQAYPDVDELPEEVINRIVTTAQTPIEAYRGYLLELKDLEIAKLKKQQLNRADTPGSAAGLASVNYDAFLNEFNAD